MLSLSRMLVPSGWSVGKMFTIFENEKKSENPHARRNRLLSWLGDMQITNKQGVNAFHKSKGHTHLTETATYTEICICSFRDFDIWTWTRSNGHLYIYIFIENQAVKQYYMVKQFSQMQNSSSKNWKYTFEAMMKQWGQNGALCQLLQNHAITIASQNNIWIQKFNS